MSLREKMENAKEVDMFPELSQDEKIEAIVEGKVQIALIKELEKIKGEIRNKRIIDPDFDFDTAGWCIDLIERNIKKLKKENKE